MSVSQVQFYILTAWGPSHSSNAWHPADDQQLGSSGSFIAPRSCSGLKYLLCGTSYFPGKGRPTSCVNQRMMSLPPHPTPTAEHSLNPPKMDRWPTPHLLCSHLPSCQDVSPSLGAKFSEQCWLFSAKLLCRKSFRIVYH